MSELKDNKFTLIELLVAVTIVAILGAIAIPHFESYLNTKHKTGTNEAH